MLNILSVCAQNFWRSLSGATATKYGLIAADVAIAIAATAGLGNQLAALFN